RAIAGLEIEIALRIDGRATAAVPEAAEAAVGSGVIDADLLGDVGRIVGHHPTVIRTVITVRGKGHIDRAVEQRERRAAMRTQRIPEHMPGAVVIATAHAGIIGGADDVRAVEIGAFGPGAQIERVQTLYVNGAGLLGLDDDINGRSDGID